MATKRKFGYYIKGNKIALIQREDTVSDPNNSEYGMYKSPIESIADGLEIQYTHVPDYLITDTAKVDTNITAYRSNGGYLEIGDATSSYTNYGNLSGYNITDGSYIVLRNAGRFNGLHKTITKTNLNGTNDTIKLETKYSGSSSWTNFEETVSLYYYVDAFIDESFELDISRYQANAIVYYLKALMAEDAGNLDVREFFMREFKRQIEKSESSKKRGPYIVQGLKEMR